VTDGEISRSGLGGGGQLDATVANNATVAVYTCFAVFAFFAGSICNMIGVRWMLPLGGSGYVVSVLSYICYDHTQNQGFVIFGGALAGTCAALLWTGQGAIILSYPTEEQKGRYISLNWAIFNTGAVIGALV
jgi:MFS family permease